MDGGGSALVVRGGSKCLVSFPWETTFFFGAFAGPKMALGVAFFSWETSFSFEAYVGSEVAFVVPTPAGWLAAEALAVDKAVVRALPAAWTVGGTLGAVVA